ncbi:MAG: hypothetical protein II233_07590, partial [Clostridia bacterium]|nr:hypothetical protein [Clostridia bacterium]
VENGILKRRLFVKDSVLKTCKGVAHAINSFGIGYTTHQPLKRLDLNFTFFSIVVCALALQTQICQNLLYFVVEKSYIPFILFIRCDILY